MRSLAARSVELFDDLRPHADPRHRRRAAAAAQAQTVEAFRELLPAVTTLVAGHFRRVLLEQAEERMEA